MKIRLDQYLCQNGYAQSRERAKALIMSGIVFVNEQKGDKAGEMIAEDAKVEVRGHDIGYVSRGGLKLEKAMQVFPMRPDGKVCMDIGASTGGFTDCMLKNGAVKVYAVDVGYGQLAFALALVLAIIVMYDAMGVRRETGEQAKILNRMLSEWMDRESDAMPFLGDKKLKEMVGHTPIQVLTGAIFGIAVGLLMPMV